MFLHLSANKRLFVQFVLLLRAQAQFERVFRFLLIIFIIFAYIYTYINLADHGVHSCRETYNPNNHYRITNSLPYSYQRNKVAVMGYLKNKNYCYLTNHTLSISYPMMNDYYRLYIHICTISYQLRLSTIYTTIYTYILLSLIKYFTFMY